MLSDLLSSMAAEENQALLIARELGFGEISSTKSLPTKDYCLVWREYHKRKGTKVFYGRPSPSSANAKHKQKPYRPWPLQRKQSTRLRNLQKRISAKYSIPLLYMDILQNEILKNPNYYGMCPLPDSASHFPLCLPNFAQLEAIKKENELRALGL